MSSATPPAAGVKQRRRKPRTQLPLKDRRNLFQEAGERFRAATKRGEQVSYRSIITQIAEDRDTRRSEDEIARKASHHAKHPTEYKQGPRRADKEGTCQAYDQPAEDIYYDTMQRKSDGLVFCRLRRTDRAAPSKAAAPAVPFKAAPPAVPFKAAPPAAPSQAAAPPAPSKAAVPATSSKVLAPSKAAAPYVPSTASAPYVPSKAVTPYVPPKAPQAPVSSSNRRGNKHAPSSNTSATRQAPADYKLVSEAEDEKLRAEEEATGMFQPEAIVDERRYKDKRQYRIHWNGYDSSQDTWENADTYDHDDVYKSLVDTFRTNNTISSKTPKRRPRKRRTAGDNNSDSDNDDNEQSSDGDPQQRSAEEVVEDSVGEQDDSWMRAAIAPFVGGSSSTTAAIVGRRRRGGM